MKLLGPGAFRVWSLFPHTTWRVFFFFVPVRASRELWQNFLVFTMIAQCRSTWVESLVASWNTHTLCNTEPCRRAGPIPAANPRELRESFNVNSESDSFLSRRRFALEADVHWRASACNSLATCLLYVNPDCRRMSWICIDGKPFEATVPSASLTPRLY